MLHKALSPSGCPQSSNFQRTSKQTSPPCCACRLCYWLGVPTVSCAELPRLASPEGVPSAGAGAGAGANHRVPHAHTPPAVEICIAQVLQPPFLALHPASMLPNNVSSGALLRSRGCKYALILRTMLLSEHDIKYESMPALV